MTWLLCDTLTCHVTYANVTWREREKEGGKGRERHRMIDVWHTHMYHLTVWHTHLYHMTVVPSESVYISLYVWRSICVWRSVCVWRWISTHGISVHVYTYWATRYISIYVWRYMCDANTSSHTYMSHVTHTSVMSHIHESSHTSECTAITADCIWSVISCQTPISISLVSFRRNVVKETSRTRSSIEIWEWRNKTPNAIGCTPPNVSLSPYV